MPEPTKDDIDALVAQHRDAVLPIDGLQHVEAGVAQ